MGMFSFCCSKTQKSIPAMAGARVVMVLPDNIRIHGDYDGYGHLLGEEVYDHNGHEMDIDTDVPHIVLDEQGLVDLHCSYGSYVVPGFSCRDDAFADDNFELIEDQFKLVHEPEYNGESYDQLAVSLRCPYQGFFYDFSQGMEGMDGVDLSLAYRLVG